MANERAIETLDYGTVLIGSDGHYWPGDAPPAHRAFCQFAKKLKPDIVIFNGDALDGAGVSRHAKIGWEKSPTLYEEIETCKLRLSEIEQAAKKSKLYWTLGNHDARFETYVANRVPEYEKIKGVHLKDHFSKRWHPCWAVEIQNSHGDPLLITKHRWKGGIHAASNNVKDGGCSIAVGHSHALEVRAHTNYQGTTYGINCGMLGDPWGHQFEYLEDAPRNWRAGFIVCTFEHRRLLWPEVVPVVDKNTVFWRGKLMEV